MAVRKDLEVWPHCRRCGLTGEGVASLKEVWPHWRGVASPVGVWPHWRRCGHAGGGMSLGYEVSKDLSSFGCSLGLLFVTRDVGSQLLLLPLATSVFTIID